MIDPKPGTREAKRQGCTCTLPDLTAVIDDAVEKVTGFPPHHATGIPKWQTDNCPLHSNKN